jgi:hypothetical protein
VELKYLRERMDKKVAKKIGRMCLGENVSERRKATKRSLIFQSTWWIDYRPNYIWLPSDITRAICATAAGGMSESTDYRRNSHGRAFAAFASVARDPFHIFDCSDVFDCKDEDAPKFGKLISPVATRLSPNGDSSMQTALDIDNKRLAPVATLLASTKSIAHLPTKPTAKKTVEEIRRMTIEELSNELESIGISRDVWSLLRYKNLVRLYLLRLLAHLVSRPPAFVLLALILYFLYTHMVGVH